MYYGIMNPGVVGGLIMIQTLLKTPIVAVKIGLLLKFASSPLSSKKGRAESGSVKMKARH